MSERLTADGYEPDVDPCGKLVKGKPFVYLDRAQAIVDERDALRVELDAVRRKFEAFYARRGEHEWYANERIFSQRRANARMQAQYDALKAKYETARQNMIRDVAEARELERKAAATEADAWRAMLMDPEKARFSSCHRGREVSIAVNRAVAAMLRDCGQQCECCRAWRESNDALRAELDLRRGERDEARADHETTKAFYEDERRQLDAMRQRAEAAEALRAQVAMLREALTQIESDARHLAAEHNKGFEHYAPRMDSNARDWMDTTEQAAAALAATGADAKAWLERQRKLAAADVLERLANEKDMETRGEECSFFRGVMMTTDCREVATQLRKEAEV